MTSVKKVTIMEVGPRDGLQNEKIIIPTETKAEFIEQLAQTGLRHIEVTSFVHPKAVPQLSDAAELLKLIQPHEGVTYWALVPNMKGLERAIETGIRHIAVFTAATDTFNQRNINMTVQESLDVFRPVIERAIAEGLTVRGYVSTAFCCPYEGKVNWQAPLGVSKALLDLGVSEISIGDTIGQALPADVEETVGHLLEHIPVEKLAMHFHDTNGLALENVQVALKLGIDKYDSSAGGLGGCPYAPGASGNLATDKLVRMLHGMGIETGVDLDKLRRAFQPIEAAVNEVNLAIGPPQTLAMDACERQ